jgi:hypothetical protein
VFVKPDMLEKLVEEKRTHFKSKMFSYDNIFVGKHSNE